MKNFVLFTLFLFVGWQASAQNYLQLGHTFFENGDYEAAKKNYILHQAFDGADMSAEIKKADECFRTLIMADDYFNNKKYEEARDRYINVLEKNPKDSYAKKQYSECEKLLNEVVSSNQTPPSNNQRHPAEPEMVFVQGGTLTKGLSKYKYYK